MIYLIAVFNPNSKVLTSRHFKMLKIRKVGSNLVPAQVGVTRLKKGTAQ